MWTLNTKRVKYYCMWQHLWICIRMISVGCERFLCQANWEKEIDYQTNSVALLEIAFTKFTKYSHLTQEPMSNFVLSYVLALWWLFWANKRKYVAKTIIAAVAAATQAKWNRLQHVHAHAHNMRICYKYTQLSFK